MTTVHEFALASARKYLQSVVFVDDEIYQPVQVPGVDISVPGAPKMELWAKPLVPKAGEAEEPDAPTAGSEVKVSLPAGGMYHPKHLVESFARERMVCALYEPSAGFSTDSDSDLFKLCERADAVILDWEFYKEPGVKVMALIANLVEAAQTTFPHHVRLIVIYTSTQNLKQICQKVFDHLVLSGRSVEVDGEYALNAGSSRIVVLGKPTVGRPSDQKTAAEVAEADLAQKVILEFASMHEGILPSIALHALASVRMNTKKILDKFRKEMDGAFLVHRGLILPGDDAFEQIPELLAEETLAVMMDTWIGSAETASLADKTIDVLNIQTALRDKNGKDTEAGKFALKLLKRGPASLKDKIALDPANLKLLHSDLDSSRSSAAERLAALYACRTQYGDDRYLEFGTIVRFDVMTEKEVAETKFAICLMPICDCVRLKQDKIYRFPFWDLRVDNESAQSKGISVELPDGGFVELFSLGKPRDQLWIEEFTAGASSMVMAKRQGSKFVFEGRGKSVEWVAQLKPNHAQRIAHDIGNSFARIGVLEAEWLRLKAERSR